MSNGQESPPSSSTVIRRLAAESSGSIWAGNKAVIESGPVRPYADTKRSSATVRGEPA